MANTYRKNSRWYRRYRGVNHSTYNDKTVQGVAKGFESHIMDSNGCFVNALYWDGKNTRHEVVVGDCDNIPRYHITGDTRRMLHQIDRARQKQALIKDMKNDPEDAIDNWITIFEPWDYD